MWPSGSKSSDREDVHRVRDQICEEQIFNNAVNCSQIDLHDYKSSVSCRMIAGVTLRTRRANEIKKRDLKEDKM